MIVACEAGVDRQSVEGYLGALYAVVGEDSDIVDFVPVVAVSCALVSVSAGAVGCVAQV